MAETKQKIEEARIVIFEPNDLVVDTAFTQENHVDSEDL